MSPRDTLIAYLRMKVDQEDWHGVADAACDLRVMEAASTGPLTVPAPMCNVAVSATTEGGHGKDLLPAEGSKGPA